MHEVLVRFNKLIVIRSTLMLHIGALLGTIQLKCFKKIKKLNTFRKGINREPWTKQLWTCSPYPHMIIHLTFIIWILVVTRCYLTRNILTNNLRLNVISHYWLNAHRTNHNSIKSVNCWLVHTKRMVQLRKYKTVLLYFKFSW